MPEMTVAPGGRVAAIEERARGRWDEADAFRQRDRGRPKWYVMELPPFATGGLHLGHARNYVLADACARFRRMAGYDVLYTTGYDTFGLPSEVAARDAGVHPEQLVADCCATMGAQLRRLGLSHDPDRITAYHEPRFYRWVQWVFLRLLAAGHCERREGPALWCAGCDASLAESLLVEGRCWRCGGAAETRVVAQWYVMEHRFADALLAGMNGLDGWPRTVRRIHADWIGRRHGRYVSFAAVGDSGATLDLFIADGASAARAAAIGIGAEHPLAGRVAAARHGAFAAPLPVLVIDDQLIPAPGAAIPLVPGLNPQHDRLLAAAGIGDAPGAAIEPEGIPASICRLRDWSIARQRYWGPPVPVVHCDACGLVPAPERDLPILLPRLPLDRPGNPLTDDGAFRATTCPRCGGAALRDTDTFEAYSSPWWYHWNCMEPDDASPFEADTARRYLPVDVMVGGSDQIRSCFFHVRMIAKALADIGLCDVDEPVDTLIAIGMIKSDGRKMSKSAGNAVSLDALLDVHGADAVRVAVLAAAAPDRDANWNDALIRRATAFLAAVGRFARSGALAAHAAVLGDTRHAGLRDKLGRWVGTAALRVTADLLRHDYHLAVKNVEALFDRIAQFERETRETRGPADAAALGAAWATFARLLAPIAPHLAEHIWEAAGERGLCMFAAWPAALAAETRRDRAA